MCSGLNTLNKHIHW